MQLHDELLDIWYQELTNLPFSCENATVLIHVTVCVYLFYVVHQCTRRARYNCSAIHVVTATARPVYWRSRQRFVQLDKNNVPYITKRMCVANNSVGRTWVETLSQCQMCLLHLFIIIRRCIE